MPLTLSHYPINNAWGFIFHREDQNPSQGAPIRLDSEPYFYPTRAGALEALDAFGMQADKAGKVTMKPDTAPTMQVHSYVRHRA